MVTVLQSTLRIVFSMEFIMGTLGNGFIFLIVCIDWVQRRKISLVDQIRTALAISRIALIWLVFLDCWVSVHYPELHETGKMLSTYLISWMVINHCNFWLTANLSILYFLKIANFSNIIFLYVKFRSKNVVLVTLLVSLFFLFLNTVIIKIYSDVCFDSVQRNVSQNFIMYNHEQICKFLSFTNPMFTFIPFVMSTVMFSLLIFSLWRHLKNIQHTTKGCRDISTTVHIRALQTIIVSVVLYTIFFLSFFVKVWSFVSPERYLIFLFVWALGNAVFSAHPFVMILVNRRLRLASLSLISWFWYRFKNIEV
ncbi:taste receptor type 2 member 113 [Mus caroli]|uniref:Taste receptor type 2 n=1 Tax=Mus caroli TaxID=10089 RepID=A0A6P5PNW2_MUSCR|nr:taste receptor type 2 member 113 [Mus caroli]